MNIIDYVKKHQDEEFSTFKFNEIDNLVLSLIPYIDFTNIVPAFKQQKITLKEAQEKLKNKPHGLFITNTYKMLGLMAKSKRYQNIKMANYIKIVNQEMQFAALTMEIPDHSLFIAFGGTDTSIIGWEEDFKMAYLYPGVSQKYAGVYLKKVLRWNFKKVRIGGHSKGGNLAISGVMNIPFYMRKNIVKISNFDGPGFLKEQVESNIYKKISQKIKMYIPSYSVIGMFLYHNLEFNVVKAKGFNIFQHDAFNWLCLDKEFVKAKQNKKSVNLSLRLSKKLESLSVQDKINLINNIFQIFKDNNITDTSDINLKTIHSLVKSFKGLDKETKDLFLELLLVLFKK